MKPHLKFFSTHPSSVVVAALYPSPKLDRANRRAPTSTSCPLSSVPSDLSLSLSLDVDNKSNLLILFSLYFFFLSFRYEICFGWMGVLLVLLITRFLFLISLSLSLCYTVYIYIYIYIFCLFTQPCLINYNVHYEFSDFCFCDFFFVCPACFPFMFLVWCWM